MSPKRKVIPVIVDLVLAGILLSLTLKNGYLFWHWLVSGCIFVLLHIIDEYSNYFVLHEEVYPKFINIDNFCSEVLLLSNWRL